MPDYEKMLDELLNDESDRMTAWEVEFVESLDKQRDREWSQKQRDILDRIWQKVNP